MQRSEEALTARLDTIRGMISYYSSVAIDPGTLDAEIARHAAEIAKHEAAISRLQTDKRIAHDEVERLRQELQNTTALRNYKRLENKLKKQYKLMEREMRELRYADLRKTARPVTDPTDQ